MDCFDKEINWWLIKTESIHIFIKKSQCIDLQYGIYGEDDEGNFYNLNFNENFLKKSSWNFDLIPIEKYDLIVEAIIKNDVNFLLKIHNEYLLSGELMCCPSKFILENFKTFFNEH